MAISDNNLIKIKTISKSMVKQIQHVPYKRSGDKANPTLWDRIYNALMDGRIKPIGWIPGDVVGSSDYVSFWLIHFENRYWWFMCPDKGSNLGQMHAQIEQLFV